MGAVDIMHTGKSAMAASKTALATTGHNISNVNTEGYSRQRVHFSTSTPEGKAGDKKVIGQGVDVTRVDRLNDGYLEKQIRNSSNHLKNFEEKGLALNQIEDIFNEMNGDGLNRLISRFFNEFRKLSNDPNNEAIRQSVREATASLVQDFRRLRNEVMAVQVHLDNRIGGYVDQANALVRDISELNTKIMKLSIAGGSPNDLLDKRDQLLKELQDIMYVTSRTDNKGAIIVELPGIGPLIAGPNAEQFDVNRTPADTSGKPENAYDVLTTASVSPNVTHRVKGGKMGALIEVRDQTLSTILNRLDELAFNITGSVNEIHRQGITRSGATGVDYFKPLSETHRAAEMMDLAQAIKGNVNNIAAAVERDAPGDNRIAIAISGLQGMRLMSEGRATMDDFYNSIVSDVGVLRARTESALNQQKDIMTQMNKMREQISGVSIDEETANLLQYQHTFDASAKVIQVADEMLETVLSLKR